MSRAASKGLAGSLHDWPRIAAPFAPSFFKFRSQQVLSGEAEKFQNYLTAFSTAALRDSGVRGAIKDELGAAIGNATVLIYTDRVTLTRTKANGAFSIGVPGHGLFDVFVSAPGFAPACSKIEVKKGQWVPFNRKLHVDPLTVKLYGDNFDTNAPHANKP